MQKRVVYNFNAQTVAQTAAVHANGKAVKASNAIGKIKRAFSGKSLKLAVFVVLLFASLFCTIGSADWIISQQKNVPNGKDDPSAEKTFTIDEIGFDNYIDIPDITFNGKPASAETKTTANDGARELPKEAVDVNSGNVKYKVKPYKTSAQSRLLRAPQKAASTEKNNAPAADAATNLPDESYFESGYTEELPTDAGTYAVLITSTVKDASSGKTISYGKAIKVFTIAPCPVNIEWSGAVDFVYDGTNHIDNITATAKTADGTVINGIVDKSYSYATEPGATASTVTEVKNAGTYTATASITNKNYVISSGEAANPTATFTVSQKELTVKADNKTVIYGESAPKYTATYEGLLDCDNGKLGTPVFSCDYPTKNHDADTYVISVGGLANSNYHISYETGTLTVTQRTVTLNWGTTNSFVYDGTAQTLTPTAQNVVNNDNLGLTVTITGEKITGSSAINAGTYTATASITNENYVIAAESETATFTITTRTVTLDWGANSFAYDGNAHTLTPTVQNVVNNGNLGLTVTVTGEKITGSSAINAGTYTATAKITNANYMLAESSKTATFTITTRTLTVRAKDNSITYGDKPSAKGYEISGFVNNENESVITGLNSITYTFDYNQYDNIYNGTEKLKYYITPEIKGLSAKNYTFLAEKGNLTINKLPLTFADNAVISRKYTKNGISFSKDLFNAAEDNKNTTCYFKSTGVTLTNDILNNIYKDVSTATSAINFSGEKDTTKPENGFYSYTTFNDKITAGSTYLISGVQLNDNSNFYLKLGSNSIYLKYCTAKIGDDFYTIEDALAQSGTITLCGDASTASSYVITAFARFNNLSGTGFENYKANYEYTLKSNSTLQLPYNDNGDTLNSTFDTNQNTSDFVYSALILSSGISLTIEKNSTLTIGANVYTPKSGTLVSDVQTRSIVYNNGIINVNGEINCNGFLKGNGQSDNEKESVVFLNNTGVIYDWMRAYNYGGGGRTKALHEKKVFPFEAYSLHNNSCNTVIVSGAQYICNLRLYPTIKVEAKINIVGNSNAMFKIQSKYIVKSTATASALTTITGDNQIKGQRDIVTVHGTCYDSQLKVDAGVSISTSTDYPLPIGFMDIVISGDGNLTFQASSYKFMPSSSLTIEAGGILNVTKNVSLTFYDNELCKENEAKGQKQKFGVYTTPAKLIVNGSAVFSDTSAVSGLIEAGENATLTIVDNQTLLKVPLSFSGGIFTTTVEIEEQHPLAVGIQTDSGTATTLNPGSYISTQGQDGNYYWIVSDQLKTITFENDSTVLKTVSVVLEKSNDTLTPYTIKAEDLPTEPTKNYYTFDGWYVGDSKLIPGTTTITDNTVFTAKWIPNKYNIEYVHVGCTDEQLATITSDNPTQYTYNEKLVLKTPTSTSPELNFMGWFSNSECTTPITEIAIGTHGNTTIYGKWTTEQLKKYTITYESGLEGVSLNITTAETTGFASGFTYKIPTIKATWDGKTAILSPDFMNSTDLSKLVEEHHYNFSKYFAGWYVYSAADGETLLDTLNETCPTIEKAQDIILKPIWKDKAVLRVSFANSKGADFVSDNGTFSQKTKYFTPGCSISNVIISAACGEYTKNVCDFMGEQYQFTKYSTAQGDNADIAFPAEDGAIVEITSYYTRYYYINISGNGISLTGSNPYTVEPTTTSFKISDKVTLSEGYEIKSYTVNGVNSNSDTINLRNYDPYTEINVVVNTQLKQYTLTITQNNYSGGVTVTDSTGKRYTNGDSISHGTNITIKTNSSTKATIEYAGNSITIKKDKSHEITPVTSDVTITADDDSGGCLVEGTLITLADGTKKKVEDLKMGDILLVYNHETGKLDSSPLLVNVHAGEEKVETNIINLKFSNGSLLRICYEHGLFDNTLNKYVYINENNYLDYLGHSFYSASWNEGEFIGKTVKLVNAYITTETIKLYNPATVWHLNLFAENMLTLSAGMTNFFEYDENMKYDEELMKADIEKYGLYTYEDFKDYVSEEVFNAFPFKYFKVSVGKGEFTFEKILWLIGFYNDSTSLK